MTARALLERIQQLLASATTGALDREVYVDVLFNETMSVNATVDDVGIVHCTLNNNQTSTLHLVIDAIEADPMPFIGVDPPDTSGTEH